MTVAWLTVEKTNKTRLSAANAAFFSASNFPPVLRDQRRLKPPGASSVPSDPSA
jgi:hypothetical protein